MRNNVIFFHFCLHIKQICVRAASGVAAGTSSLPAHILKIEHFSFDVVDKVLTSPDRRKHDRELWTIQNTKAPGTLWFPRGPRPQPEWHARYRRHDCHSITGIGQETTVGPYRRQFHKATRRTIRGNPADGNDLLKRDINLNVSNPKPETSVRGYVYGSHVIVPEPGDREKVGNRHSNYRSVSTNWDGTDT